MKGIEQRPVSDHTLELAAGEHRLMASRLLGELLDRRTNALGYRVTQSLADKIGLKLANKLAGSPRATTCDCNTVDSFLRNLREALCQSCAKWYWFTNPDVSAPAGVTPVHTEHINGPDYSCFGGFEQCFILFDGAEVDARTYSRFEVSEGLIGIAHETASERYAGELGTAIERLSQYAANDPITLALVPAGAKRRKSAWPTFSRSRLSARAKPFPRTARAHLATRMADLGFQEGRHPGLEGAVLWVRGEGETLQYVAVDAERFAAAFRIFLSIRNEPFEAGAYGAELLAPSGQSFDYGSHVQLEAALDTAFEQIATLGVAWLDDSGSKSRDEWLSLGVLPRS